MERGGSTDLDDTSPMSGENELTLAPFVTHTLVYCYGSDSIRLILTVTDVFIQQDDTIQRGDDQPTAT
jgi:hypothetical protein